MLTASAATMRTCMPSQGHGQHTARARVSAVLHHETATTRSCRTVASVRCEAVSGRDGLRQPKQQVTATESSRQRRAAYARPQQDKLTETPARVKPQQHRGTTDEPREKQCSTGDKGPRRPTAYQGKQGPLKQYHQKNLSPRQLTGLVKQTAGPAELLQLVQQHSQQFDYIAITAAITQLGQWQRKQLLKSKDATTKEQLLRELEQQLLSNQEHLQHCEPRQLSNIIWSCSLLKYTKTPMFRGCMQDFSAKLPTSQSMQDVSNVLYGLATSKQQITQDQLNVILAAAARQDLLDLALPQEVSNILWSAATMDWYMSEQQVQQLVACLLTKSAAAKPQGISNALWAIATMQQSIPQWQLQQLVACLVRKLAVAKPQAVSNTLWALATMQRSVPQQQLQQLVACLISKLADARPQHVSNTLWAVATLQETIDNQQLEQLVAHLIDKLFDLGPQEVSNTLWACGQLRYLPEQLLKVLQEQQLWSVLLPDMDSTELAQVAVGLGTLGHKDQQLMAAVLEQATIQVQQQQHADKDMQILTNSSSRGLMQSSCNICWSIAVLDMQQHAPSVLTLVRYCAPEFHTCEQEELRQLQQVHLWLNDVQQPDAADLSSVLSAKRLKQCRAAWVKVVQHNAFQDQSQFQKDVFATLQQLPLTWHSPPATEQLCEPDGMLSMDISGVTADGVRLAIEADGPSHFRRPDNGLTGNSLYRNRALAARGYVVVSVPVHEWSVLIGQKEKQQYLMSLVQEQLATSKMIAAAATAGRRRKQPTTQQQQEQLPEEQQAHRQQEQQIQQQLEQQNPLPVTATGRVRRIRRRQVSSDV